MTDIATVRRYWDDRPCNIKHSDRPLGTLAYFSEVRARKYHVEPHIPGFASFGSWAGQDVLEVGCGIGTDATEFALHGARVTAIDLSPRAVELTNERARVYRLTDRLRAHVANVEHLSDTLLDRRQYGAFRLIYAFGSLHHTLDPARALRELRHWADDRTHLKLMLYHRWSWKAIAVTRGRPWRDDLLARGSEAQPDCPVTHAYSRSGACRLLEATGWWVTGLRVTHIFPYRIGPYTAGRYVKLPHWRLLRALEPALGWHMLIDARRR